jgi:8-oxo-dGTP diphosphatase
VGQPPQRPILDVHLLLVRDGQILLTRRRGGYAANGWHAPSGKADAGESIVDAVVREAQEEIGVIVDPDDLRCVHAMHVQHDGEEPRVGFFFEATRWISEPANREPEKCSAVRWFDLTNLPDAMIPYPAAGISGYLAGIPFSVFGWDQRTPQPTSPQYGPSTPAMTTGPPA